jgi:hypothetical protein
MKFFQRNGHREWLATYKYKFDIWENPILKTDYDRTLLFEVK